MGKKFLMTIVLIVLLNFLSSSCSGYGGEFIMTIR